MAKGQEKPKKIEVKTPTTNEKKSKQKVLILLAGICVTIVAVGSLTLAPEQGPVKRERRSEFIDLTPGNNKDWRTEMQMQYKAMVRNSEEQTANTNRSLGLVSQALETMRDQDTTIKSLVTQIKALEEREPVERIIIKDDSGKSIAENQEIPVKKLSVEDRIKKQLKDQNDSSDNAMRGVRQPLANRVLPPPPGMPYGKAKETGVSNVDTLSRKTALAKIDHKPMVFVAREDNYDDSPAGENVESAFVENEYAGFIPPGSFADITLLSGLDSGTSEYTRANPQPVLMRVQSDAQLPQGNYNIKSCFVLGSSYGDLSSERVFVQLSRITCVDKARGMMLTGSIQGFVTDSDSMQGLKGKVIRRSGQLIGKSMLAGFASGLSQVAATAGTTQVQTVSGAINSTLDTDRILETGGLQGVGTTMETIAKQYMDEAKNMFPVISVSGGRVGTMILTQGTKLEWKSFTGKYEKEIRPAALETKLF